MYGYSGSMFSGGMFMWLFMIILLLAVVYALRFSFGASGKDSLSSNEAMSILKQRFAKGEIDETEFEHRKHQLSK